VTGQTIRVVLPGYDGFQTLDLIGPLDALGPAPPDYRNCFSSIRTNGEDHAEQV